MERIKFIESDNFFCCYRINPIDEIKVCEEGYYWYDTYTNTDCGTKVFTYKQIYGTNYNLLETPIREENRYLLKKREEDINE